MLLTEAPGATVVIGNGSHADISNVNDGYFCVMYNGSPNKKCFVMVECNGQSQKFKIVVRGCWIVIPLCFGDGLYSAMVYQETTLPNYREILKTSFNVKYSHPYAPFLRPNTYCNYNAYSLCVKVAQDLGKDAGSDIDVVSKLARWIIDTLEYDKEQAARAKAGELAWWLPDPDTVLQKRKGICWEYASLFTALCRINEIPCTMQVGWTGTVYHSWNEIVVQTAGTLDTGGFTVLADKWLRLDLTFMDSGNMSKSVLDFVKECKHYTVEYSG